MCDLSVLGPRNASLFYSECRYPELALGIDSPVYELYSIIVDRPAYVYYPGGLVRALNEEHNTFLSGNDH